MSQYRFRNTWATQYAPAGRDENTNKLPVYLSIKEPITIEGVVYMPFTAYCTGRIYTSVTINKENPRSYDVITASFTGFSKDQMKLFIRGTYMSKKGSIGMFVERPDLELVIKIIKEYNKTLGFESTYTIIDPNIIDKDLFEL